MPLQWCAVRTHAEKGKGCDVLGHVCYVDARGDAGQCLSLKGLACLPYPSSACLPGVPAKKTKQLQVLGMTVDHAALMDGAFPNLTVFLFQKSLVWVGIQLWNTVNIGSVSNGIQICIFFPLLIGSCSQAEMNDRSVGGLSKSTPPPFLFLLQFQFRSPKRTMCSSAASYLPV